MMRRQNLEHLDQVALFEWAARLEKRQPLFGMLYAIPNAGKRTKFQGKWLKDEGLKPGVPDICLPVPRHGYHGLYIELKIPPNGPTSEQLDWLKALRNQGYKSVLCNGQDQAKQVIADYLKGGV